MNKAMLAREIDHALKSANNDKNIIKGMGWKGKGHRYYTGGFIIGTGLSKCVVVRYRVRYELLPLRLSMVDDSQLTEKGIAHKQKIRNETRDAIDKYKTALSHFEFSELQDEYGLPYLVVTEKKAT